MTDSPVEPPLDPILDNVDPAPLPAPQPYPGNYNADLKPGPQKAWWGGAVSFLVLFAGSLQVAVASGADLGNWQVWLNVLLVAIVGGGGTGATVWNTTNKIGAR